MVPMFFGRSRMRDASPYHPGGCRPQAPEQAEPVPNGASRSSAPFCAAHFGARGFTLVEVLVSLAVIGLTISTAFFALNRMNQFSFANRLYTEAQAAAENQVDILLTKGPFDPTRSTPRIPAELAVGTTTKSGVIVYIDPISNQPVVTGSLVTTVSDPSLTQTISPGGVANTQQLNVRQLKVEVDYTYRSTPYSVVMNSVRTADQ